MVMAKRNQYVALHVQSCIELDLVRCQLLALTYYILTRHDYKFMQTILYTDNVRYILGLLIQEVDLYKQAGEILLI